MSGPSRAAPAALSTSTGAHLIWVDCQVLAGTEGEIRIQMIKPKRTAAEQVEDEAARRALNPLASRQTISDSQAEPEFQENHKRLKADRMRREAALKAKGK